MHKQKVLILGGTSFVGRNITETLVEQDQFSLTLFNRGVSNPTLFPGVNRIVGDRNKAEDVERLFNEHWDYIIDVSCFYPAQLRHVLKGINRDLKNYLFVSTCSVYDNSKYTGRLRDEMAPILPCTADEEVDTSNQTYGNRKAACEGLLRESGLPYAIFRPALIYGQYDPTDRLYYWLHQTRTRNETLLPENGERNFSMTYIKDLVTSLTSVINQNIVNETFNCISHPSTSISEIVSTCEANYGTSPIKYAASADFLKENEVAQWSGIPLWLNTDDFTYSNQKLMELAGFLPTSLDQGILETIQYFDGRGYETPIFGLDQTEVDVLINKLKAA